MVEPFEAVSALRGATIGHDLPNVAAHDAPTGIRLRERRGETISLAVLGDAAVLHERMAMHWGVILPTTPRRIEAGALAFIWSGPRRWMATGPPGSNLETLVREKLDGLAAITDQGDSRAVLRISGPCARDTLAKLVGIDLHPRAFRPGDTALCVAAHINIHLWQIDEQPSFDIAVPRSLALSFHHALCIAAAAFGIDAAFDQGDRW